MFTTGYAVKTLKTIKLCTKQRQQGIYVYYNLNQENLYRFNPQD